MICNSTSLLQRQQLNPPKEHLRPFRLKQDLPLRVRRLRADVDDDAIEDVGDRVAGANAFQRVPFADRFLDIVFAAEAFHVLDRKSVV